MSITIDIDAVATGEFRVTCPANEDAPVGTFNSREAAEAAVTVHAAVCEDCNAYGNWPTPVLDIETDGVNMANGNAVLIFAALGIEFDWAGSMPGAEFLGHVLIALGMPRDDSGVEPVEWRGAGGATHVDCGVRAGYVGQRLGQLADLATEAARLGRDVTWG